MKKRLLTLMLCLLVTVSSATLFCTADENSGGAYDFYSGCQLYNDGNTDNTEESTTQSTVEQTGQPTTESQEGVEYPFGNKCGDNLTFRFEKLYFDAPLGGYMYNDEKGFFKWQLIISGTGEMYDYKIASSLDEYMNNTGEYAPWHTCVYEIYEIIVEDGVTSIGANAFVGHKMDWEELSQYWVFTEDDGEQGISIDEYIEKEIARLEREQPYKGCCATKVIIPESVKKINSNAFKYCYNLYNVLFEANDTAIAADAFNTSSDILKIYGHEGSTALEYAKANQLLNEAYTGKASDVVIVSRTVPTTTKPQPTTAPASSGVISATKPAEPGDDVDTGSTTSPIIALVLLAATALIIKKTKR